MSRSPNLCTLHTPTQCSASLTRYEETTARKYISGFSTPNGAALSHLEERSVWRFPAQQLSRDGDMSQSPLTWGSSKQAAPPGLENGFHWRKVTQITLMFSLITTCSLVEEVELSPSFPTMTYYPWKTSHMNAHSYFALSLPHKHTFPLLLQTSCCCFFSAASHCQRKRENGAALLPIFHVCHNMLKPIYRTGFVSRQ